MYTTHKKGVLGELEYALHLVKKGYTVLQPINPNSSYDLVVEKAGKFQRLQIKYITPSHGRLRIELDRPKRTTASYKDRGIDAFGIYNPLQQKFYLVPLSHISSNIEFWIRVDHPKNSQSKHIHLAETFEI